jgi:hypothetical protein
LKPQTGALDARQDITYAGGAEVRRDTGGTGDILTWSHEDPAGTTVQEGGLTSFGGPNASFYNPVVQLDPVGASVGWADPAQFEEPSAPPDETNPEMPVYSNPLRPGQGCSDNLVPLPCAQVLDQINWRVNSTRSFTVQTETVHSIRVSFAGTLSWATDDGDVTGEDGISVSRLTQHVISYYSVQRQTSVAEATRFSGYMWGGATARTEPQGLKAAGKAKLDERRLRECLEKLFQTEIGPSDGRTRGYDIQKGQFSGFFGKQKTPFSVVIDSTSKSLEDVRRESGVPNAIAFSDGKAAYYHGTVYIAREYARSAVPVAIAATQVHEIGNKIWDIFGGYFPQPHASPRLQKFGKDDDAGIALEECAFGGLVTKDGTIAK